MRREDVPALDVRGGAEWKRWIDRLQTRTTPKRKSRLTDRLLAENTGLDLDVFRPRFSKFKGADHAELCRWFAPRAGKATVGWLTKVAEALGSSEAEFESKLLELASGGRRRAAPWHEAFPGIEPEGMRVDPPLVGGGTLDVGALANRVRTADPGFVVVWVVGAPGSGTSTCAEWIRAELGEPWVIESPGPHVDLRAWRAAVVHPTVASVDAVRFDAEWPRRSGDGDHEVSLAPWDHLQAADLIRRLRDAEGLLDAVRRDPHRLGPPAPARRMIERIAVALRDPDWSWADGVESAWRRAESADPSGVLAELGLGFLEDLWASLWSRDSPSPWHRASREQLLQVISALIGERPNLAALRERIHQARGARGDKLKGHLRALEILVMQPPEVLEALVEARLVVPVDESIQASDPELARTWAARGALRDGRLTQSCGARSADPAWLPLARELALLDATPEDVVAALEAGPRWSRGRAGLFLVAFLQARRSAELSPSLARRVQSLWVRALWEVLHPPLGDVPQPRWRGPREPHPMAELLRRFSFRYEAVLPEWRGPEFHALVADLLPPAARQRLDPRELRHEGASRALTRTTIWLAPAQCLPYRPTCYRGDHDLGVEEWTLLERRAERGHPSARRWLSGESLSFDAHGRVETDAEDWARHWRMLPLELALRWFLTPGTSAAQGLERWRWLATGRRLEGGVLGSHRDLVMAALRRLPQDELEQELLGWLAGTDGRPFCARPWLEDPAEVLEIARELHLRSVLEAFVSRPCELLRTGRADIEWDDRGVAQWCFHGRVGDAGEKGRPLGWMGKVVDQALEAARALYELGAPERLRSLWEGDASESWDLGRGLQEDIVDGLRLDEARRRPLRVDEQVPSEALRLLGFLRPESVWSQPPTRARAQWLRSIGDEERAAAMEEVFDWLTAEVPAVKLPSVDWRREDLQRRTGWALVELGDRFDLTGPDERAPEPGLERELWFERVVTGEARAWLSSEFAAEAWTRRDVRESALWIIRGQLDQPALVEPLLKQWALGEPAPFEGDDCFRVVDGAVRGGDEHLLGLFVERFAELPVWRVPAVHRLLAEGSKYERSNLDFHGLPLQVDAPVAQPDWLDWAVDCASTPRDPELRDAVLAEAAARGWRWYDVRELAAWRVAEAVGSSSDELVALLEEPLLADAALAALRRHDPERADEVSEQLFRAALARGLQAEVHENLGFRDHVAYHPEAALAAFEERAREVPVERARLVDDLTVVWQDFGAHAHQALALAQRLAAELRQAARGAGG